MKEELPTKIAALELPILKYRAKILEMVSKNAVTLICGETGSGKTTQVPQILFTSFKRIIVSQPRRISAITLAERVAQEMGYDIGHQVGYNVRFQERRSLNTRVVFATDGMAIRELMLGSPYDLFILDQAHERSINTDVLMAVLRKRITLQIRGPQFKLIIMSATIEVGKFMKFFDSDAVINIEGRCHPTQMYNVLDPLQSYLEGTFNAVLQIHHHEQAGSILVFLTGEDDILGLQRKLQGVRKEHNLSIQVLLLYSALPHQYQHQVFQPSSDNTLRRIILATNIAETSVTIPAVRYVVDCGYMKVRTYDHSKMLDMLTVVPLSRANALQRAGRAGRQGPGKCYQLYPLHAFEQLQDYSVPQILRSELSGPILQLKAIGVAQINKLQFMDQPSVSIIQECLSLLRQIGALTPIPSEQVTQYGRQLSKLPLPPRLSHLLLMSLQYKCESIMLTLLSILSVQNIFVSSAVTERTNKGSSLHEILTKFLPVCPGGKGTTNNRLLTSDHLAKVNLLHEYMKTQNRVLFCKQNFLNKNNIKRTVLIREQLEQYLLQIVRERRKHHFFMIGSSMNSPDTSVPKGPLEGHSVQAWLSCMVKGCLYATARLDKDGRYRIHRSGQEASIHPQSLAFYLPHKPQLIIFSQVVKTARVYLKDITPIPDSPSKT